MSVLFARIDDRLIHGQTVEGWIPFLNAKEVLIVSDVTAKDENRIDLMKLSLPEHIKLKVKNMQQAVKYLKGLKSSETILLITPSPCEILSLISNGIKLGSVNVGGMHYSIGKVQIGRAIFIDDTDMECLRKIASKGVKLEGRGVPTDKQVDILARLSQ
ncbi:MAG TPA: PTS sugar transporter subunit IIB [Elusimicrobiales bacterium]|nr:PTS sugar transporter subunit IIB [Elusimicrobiales bacterium]